MITKLTVMQGLAGSSAILMFVLALGSVWAMYFESPYLTYTNIPFPQVAPALIVPGSNVSMLISRCGTNDKQIMYSSTQFAINEETLVIIAFPVIPLVILPGCQTDKNLVSKLPYDIPAGKYHFYGVTTITGGFINHDIPWTSQTFEVTEPVLAQ